jgi:hypothetical protein
LNGVASLPVTVTHENPSPAVGIGICMIFAITLQALISRVAFRENISRSPPVMTGWSRSRR